ncbi:hypothetical protein C8R43DRAFT_1148644 [Mycena crocata]|nr:hypothetical protein C8R43DRAFT_1148644 [Mycena crocata]
MYELGSHSRKIPFALYLAPPPPLLLLLLLLSSRATRRTTKTGQYRLTSRCVVIDAPAQNQYFDVNSYSTNTMSFVSTTPEDSFVRARISHAITSGVYAHGPNAASPFSTPMTSPEVFKVLGAMAGSGELRLARVSRSLFVDEIQEPLEKVVLAVGGERGFTVRQLRVIMAAVASDEVIFALLTAPHRLGKTPPTPTTTAQRNRHVSIFWTVLTLVFYGQQNPEAAMHQWAGWVVPILEAAARAVYDSKSLFTPRLPATPTNSLHALADICFKAARLPPRGYACRRSQRASVNPPVVLLKGCAIQSLRDDPPDSAALDIPFTVLSPDLDPGVIFHELCAIAPLAIRA